MTNRTLENITIHQFRGLQELELKHLGQINLLVGVNNSGKTSVLEALSIFCDPTDLKSWINAARQREDSRIPTLEALMWLFNKELLNMGSISISGNGNFAIKKLRAFCEGIEAVFSPKKKQQFVYMNTLLDDGEGDDQSLEEEVRKGLELQVDLYGSQLTLFEEQDLISSEKYQLWENDFLLSKKSTKKNLKLPISTVTPTSHRLSMGQIQLLSEASLYNFKSDVLDLINQMDQDISDIEILMPLGSRINIYIQHKKLGLVPLSSFGDGVRRLLHIALKLASVKGGILLIDELESTIHTEALQSSFEWLVKWSKVMDVQIFATTHSLEAVDALLAVNESASDLVLYRLEPKETQTKVVRHDWSRLKRLRENLGMEVR
jgi:AAA15 family ATPase/GTPase